MKNIHIGSAVLPLEDFAISRNAILGITKSGKTYLAKGIAEQLLGFGIPFVVFDAIGVWRHLKVPGAGQGYKVVVAGGESPDLPLTTHSAPAIVRAAIAGNIPLVIDLYDSKLSKADWRRIVQECFRILLYENKGMRHIFLEEAAEYAPQKVMDGQTYAEVEKLARMGGNRSLGITFINQRAQELNKAVLELCDNIILLRQRGAHAIDSLEKQMDKLDPATSKEIALTLPNMTQGDCWVFTENGDKPIRTRSKKINSYHPDRKNPDHKVLSKGVSADEFVQSMAGQLDKIIAEAKANDPTELRKRIAELEHIKPKAESKTEIKEVPALSADDYNRIETVQRLICQLERKIERQSEESIAALKEIRDGALPVFVKASQISASHTTTPVRLTPHKSRAVVPTTNGGMTPENLGRCERAILSALAQYPNGKNAIQIAILTGYSSGSGGFNNSLSCLRSSGYINRGYPIQITEDGLKALGEYDPLPTGKTLLDHWLGKLAKCERAILSTLANSYPIEMSTSEVAFATGYAQSSGGFNNSLSRLRTLELITRGQPMKASADLFD